MTEAPRLAFVGFDSAWTDNPRAPGAIASLVFGSGGPTAFAPPRLVRFAEALEAIRETAAEADFTLIALDQPTIVANATSLRPVERVVASPISWMGGGVQPSNRGRKGMFCDASPIWPFLAALGAVEDPVAARPAPSGLHLVEVFPALALASLEPAFFARSAAPRYNPERRRTFRLVDWIAVARVLAREFAALGFEEPASWCLRAADLPSPRKADQDRLDAMVCLLVAVLWRLSPPAETMMIGSLAEGYMVTPVSPQVRERIVQRAAAVGVACEELAS